MNEFNYENFLAILESIEEQYKDVKSSFARFGEEERHFETFIFTVNHYQTLIDENDITTSYSEWLTEYVESVILAY